ncbi:unnamed protein product [Moneuplotes crassus]|uniref:Uncharacterized protein n=1 Tax=Euplotes crassus TaxID=5936 RepID=A0AAD1XG95_EUPCR|nr:unnamed protein product [Moneuplotes crassus]
MGFLCWLPPSKFNLFCTNIFCKMNKESLDFCEGKLKEKEQTIQRLQKELSQKKQEVNRLKDQSERDRKETKNLTQKLLLEKNKNKFASEILKNKTQMEKDFKQKKREMKKEMKKEMEKELKIRMDQIQKMHDCCLGQKEETAKSELNKKRKYMVSKNTRSKRQCCDTEVSHKANSALKTGGSKPSKLSD